MPYFYGKLDETVRSRVESIFAEHYRGLSVKVQSAAITDGGIQVRGVSISDPKADGPRAELAYLDELILVCKTDLATLVRGTPQIVEVVARRPAIHATRRPDGTWSTSRLFPLPKFGEQPPKITIEAGTLNLFDPLKNPACSLAVRDGYFKVVRHEGESRAAAGGARRFRSPVTARPTISAASKLPAPLIPPAEPGTSAASSTDSRSDRN